MHSQVMLDALKAFGVEVNVEEGGDVLVIHGSSGSLHPPEEGTIGRGCRWCTGGSHRWRFERWPTVKFVPVECRDLPWQRGHGLKIPDHHMRTAPDRVVGGHYRQRPDEAKVWKPAIANPLSPFHKNHCAVSM